MRFLIIEDQKDVRNLMEAFLSEFGNSDMAEDGIEGLAAVLKSLEDDHPYDAIFLDIMMPKLEGQQVLQKVRKAEEAKNIVDGITNLNMILNPLTLYAILDIHILNTN